MDVCFLAWTVWRSIVEWTKKIILPIYVRTSVERTNSVWVCSSLHAGIMDLLMADFWHDHSPVNFYKITKAYDHKSLQNDLYITSQPWLLKRFISFNLRFSEWNDVNKSNLLTLACNVGSKRNFKTLKKFRKKKIYLIKVLLSQWTLTQNLVQLIMRRRMDAQYLSYPAV